MTCLGLLCGRRVFLLPYMEGSIIMLPADDLTTIVDNYCRRVQLCLRMLLCRNSWNFICFFLQLQATEQVCMLINRFTNRFIVYCSAAGEKYMILAPLQYYYCRRTDEFKDRQRSEVGGSGHREINYNSLKYNNQDYMCTIRLECILG